MSNNIRIRKIIHRCKNTGCRENDILLGNFIVYNNDTLKEQELDALESLLEYDDNTILEILSSRLKPADEVKDIVEKIIAFNIKLN